MNIKKLTAIAYFKGG
jgi:hypothetical protein